MVWTDFLAWRRWTWWTLVCFRVKADELIYRCASSPIEWAEFVMLTSSISSTQPMSSQNCLKHVSVSKTKCFPWKIKFLTLTRRRKSVSHGWWNSQPTPIYTFGATNTSNFTRLQLVLRRILKPLEGKPNFSEPKLFVNEWWESTSFRHDSRRSETSFLFYSGYPICLPVFEFSSLFEWLDHMTQGVWDNILGLS